jgi:hypothetical protein
MCPRVAGVAAGTFECVIVLILTIMVSRHLFGGGTHLQILEIEGQVKKAAH